MDIKIIYEDENLLAVDKPAGIETIQMIEILSKQKPGLEKIHRLDKDTSGVNLIAKNPEALIFFQKQFSPYGGSLSLRDISRRETEGRINNEKLEKKVEKRYIALVVGNVKNDSGRIETLIGRAPGDKRKQKVYLFNEPGSLKGKREAITEYKVLTRFEKYTLLEIIPKTGRRHQIRCHLTYINHPIAGDKKYGFKNQPEPEDLNRQFLHASHIKIKLFNGEIKELNSKLAQDLKLCLENLKKNCLI